MNTVRPDSVAALCAIVAAAAASGERLELRGGGTKALVGAPREAQVVDMRGLAGVIDYDPAELVITLRAGTPLCEVTELLAANGQHLPFEPWDYAPLFGRPAGEATIAKSTIGGVIAAGAAGPRRVTAGGARDHLLGLTAVTGRGEVVVAGARVVKNVTGYDVPKLFAGSWGRLGAMAELTLKVLPAPRETATLAITGLGPRAAQAAMAAALGSPHGVCSAAHLPQTFDRAGPHTLLRVAGFAPSITARCAGLEATLAGHGALVRLPDDYAARLWAEINVPAPLDGPVLWRLALPPSEAPALAERFEASGARWFMDWGGGLLWLEWQDGTGVDPGEVRAAAERARGHAMLLRSPETLRRAVPAQHPRVAALMALEARVRAAFDPTGVFETGRWLDV
jgi:glycolate oxidase FAD binding subunit